MVASWVGFPDLGQLAIPVEAPEGRWWTGHGGRALLDAGHDRPPALLLNASRVLDGSKGRCWHLGAAEVIVTFLEWLVLPAGRPT